MIRVLVADDSTFMREVISDTLNSESGIEVIGTAKNGFDAVRKTRELKPDVVTLDVQMPLMDGLEALTDIMRGCPTPVVMLSAFTKKDAEVVIECLRRGAVDFVAKPSGTVSPDIGEVKAELIEKVKIASKAKVHRVDVTPRKIQIKKPKPIFIKKVVCIGVSTGGPPALEEVLTKIPQNLPACILIVQHIPSFFIAFLAKRLDAQSAIMVKEAEDGELLRAGEALIAPGDYHLTLKKRGIRKVVSLKKSPRVDGHRPNISLMMESASEIYGPDTIGVILTGMGSDGVKGMEHIKMRGGRTICQDESTSVVFGMPGAVIKHGNVDKVLPIGEIAQEIMKMVYE